MNPMTRWRRSVDPEERLPDEKVADNLGELLVELGQIVDIDTFIAGASDVEFLTVGGRRYLADAITFRPTSVYPRALDLGASASVVVRRNAGNMETYTVPWTKTGYTGKVIGRVPSPQLKL